MSLYLGIDSSSWRSIRSRSVNYIETPCRPRVSLFYIMHLKNTIVLQHVVYEDESHDVYSAVRSAGRIICIHKTKINFLQLSVCEKK